MEMLEREGHCCSTCGASSDSGAVLQVHHKQYITGRMPWQYKYDECEVLCKGCHGAEHGLIKPKVGWTCIGEDDLGEPSGTCDNCGNSIRHECYVTHPHWEPMAVGTDCCDNLTGTSIASEKRKLKERSDRFVTSSRWRMTSYGATICQKGIDLSIVIMHGKFRLSLRGTLGKKAFDSIDDAKRFAFQFIESGEAQRWLARRRRFH
jgi:hypothetical protein